MAINIGIFEGTVGKDATVRSAGGDQVCGFSVSVSNGKNKDGTWKDSTWVDVSYWGKFAEEKAQRLHKGARVTVTGRVGLRKWEKDGKSGASLELRATDISIHEALPAQGSQQQRERPSYGVGGNAGQDQGDGGSSWGGFGSEEEAPF